MIAAATSRTNTLQQSSSSNLHQSTFSIMDFSDSSATDRQPAYDVVFSAPSSVHGMTAIPAMPPIPYHQHQQHQFHVNHSPSAIDLRQLSLVSPPLAMAHMQQSPLRSPAAAEYIPDDASFHPNDKLAIKQEEDTGAAGGVATTGSGSTLVAPRVPSTPSNIPVAPPLPLPSSSWPSEAAVAAAAAAAAAVASGPFSNSNGMVIPVQQHANSNNSRYQADDNSSLVTPFYSSPSSSVVQSSPSSDFSPPLPSGTTYQHYIKRRRSSAMFTEYPASSAPAMSLSYPSASTVHAAVGTPSPSPFPCPTATSAPPPASTTRSMEQIAPMLRFNVVLQASTAATQISEGSPTTYLNRNQAYAIHLQDTLHHDTVMTSTFVIMFHEPSHRKVALNYWKFWLGQQKSPLDARAVTLDEDQSIGIENIRFPSFDRITFDWNGRQGAKAFIRFNCLSTDFSRIKGVKGIPLRAHMETRVTVNVAASASLQPYAGTFQAADGEATDALRRDYVEQVYCKIKLFRDKGAERKNKDDAKQIGKHMERVYAEANPHQHPFWLMYNQPKPYSTICEVPVMASNMDCRKPLPIEQSQSQPPAATLPASTTLSSSSSSNSSSHQSSNGETPVPSSLLPSATTAPVYSRQQQQQQQQPSSMAALPQPSSSPTSPHFLTSSVLLHGVKSDPSLNSKRSYSDLLMEEQQQQHRQQQQHQHQHQQPRPTGLSLLINIKTTQHQRFQSPPSPTESSDYPLAATSTNSKRPLQRVHLESISVPSLISKLCPLLSLHYSQVSEVLWRQPRNMACSTVPFRTTTLRNSPDHGVAIILDDSVLAEYFMNGMVVGVEWEIKSDGTVRLLLQ